MIMDIFNSKRWPEGMESKWNLVIHTFDSWTLDIFAMNCGDKNESIGQANTRENTIEWWP